jgi:biopolymer transport protein ExbD
MSWKVRHEGSPRTIEGLSLEQVLEGLREGQWEPTDEVMGPGDTTWRALENHPQFAEVAADLEPPPPRTYDDETRLDMNALIDVCLVLLIFFIITTSYAALQMRLEAPGVSKDKIKGIPTLTKKKLDEQAIRVAIKMQGDKPVILVEDEAVEEARLVAKLRSFVGKSGKTIMSLECEDNVPHKTMAAVLSAARGAGVDKVLTPVR